jgi:hypothetical protein
MNDNFEIMNVMDNIIKNICVNDYEKNMINSKPDDPFILEIENHLDCTICDEIIEMFEKDARLQPGITGGGLNKSIKNTTDLQISTLIEWKKYDDILFNNLNNGIQKYGLKLNNLFFNNFLIFDNIKDKGYQIQKYNKKTGFYKWHHDSMNDNNFGQRLLTYIWYLNDVNEGGETFFLNGKIIPKKGKFLLFPATWTYLHKGNVPLSNDKYIITGWLYSKT